MSDLDLIRTAFADRQKPKTLTESASLSKHELEDVIFFQGKDWGTLSGDDIQPHHEAIFWFSPEAFCYYLPGLLSAGIKENRPDLLVFDSIINMLDRSADPYLWDEFFMHRWPLLNKEECSALKAWVFWLEQSNDYFQFSDSCARAVETLDLLEEGVTVIRLRR